MRTEAQLAGSQIALGVTALSKADHARLGNYTTAFFGLTIGLERLGKLIVIADYAIGHGGQFPDNSFLKDSISHDLTRLLDRCEFVSSTRQAATEYSKRYSKRPKGGVHHGIIQTLSEFGKLSRYYNLDLFTGGQAANLPEPIGAWWKRVGEPILSQHYTEHQRDKDNAIGDDLEQRWSTYSSIQLHSETGESINDMATVVRRHGATRVVQKYGRLYVLQIVRWLSYLISDLAQEGITRRIEPLFGVDEPFKLFLNEDRCFRTRKTWAIYPSG